MPRLGALARFIPIIFTWGSFALGQTFRRRSTLPRFDTQSIRWKSARPYRLLQPHGTAKGPLRVVRKTSRAPAEGP